MDRGPEYGKEGGPIADESRYIEIWDLVFENYMVDNVKSKTDLHIAGELKHKNIDTGAGLERLAYLAAGKNNIYETDEVYPSSRRPRRSPASSTARTRRPTSECASWPTMFVPRS